MIIKPSLVALTAQSVLCISQAFIVHDRTTDPPLYNFVIDPLHACIKANILKHF